jgi:5-methylthioadenosine/S-adenosylhomocysteine deaminase
VAPLNAFEKRGISTAIGLDEAGINDDRDMLQEMRMVLRAHRVPGMTDEDVPSTGQVLRMATVGGAATTPYSSRIGTLAVGKAADLMLIDWDKLAYPYLDPETPVLDAVIQRAKSSGVDLVMVAGEVVYEGGSFTRVDRDAALRELHDSLQHALPDDETERRGLSKALLSHVRRFYAGYFDPEAHVPYYRPSSCA